MTFEYNRLCFDRQDLSRLCWKTVGAGLERVLASVIGFVIEMGLSNVLQDSGRGKEKRVEKSCDLGEASRRVKGEEGGGHGETE